MAYSTVRKVFVLLALLTAAAPAAAQSSDPFVEEPDLRLRAGPSDPGDRPAAPPAVLATPASGAKVDVPPGFFRDRQGRVMQVSFDFGRRLWLGVGYAPHRRPTGESEIAPAAFDFGAAWDWLTPDGRTRHRVRILDGQVRLHPFGLNVTAFRYDLSHRYRDPLVRITTFFGEPERHDLYLNVGVFAEAMRFDVAPRGVAGEHELTLASLQGTLDLWQSADLRSYVRLRVGPAAEMRLGPWSEEARLVGVLPQGVLEGNLTFGRRALQNLHFRVRGNFFRTLTWTPGSLPGNWLVDGEVAYEAILLAINDQPLSLRLAGQAGVREDARALGMGAAVAPGDPGWEWRGTAGIRMSFFSPPIPGLGK